MAAKIGDHHMRTWPGVLSLLDQVSQRLIHECLELPPLLLHKIADRSFL